MKAVVATFNQEKALVGAFSVITNLRMELFEALISSQRFLYPVGDDVTILQGCSASSEGVDLQLTGRNPVTVCATRGLDHAATRDYEHAAVFDAGREEPYAHGWGSCHTVTSEAAGHHCLHLIYCCCSRARWRPR